MNKNTTFQNIIAESLFLHSVQTANFNINIHSIYSLTGIDVFYVAITPLSTLSDYIGFKSTMGGLTLIRSMLNISFITYANNNGSNVYPTTTDLNLIGNNQPQTKYRARTVLLPERVRRG